MRWLADESCDFSVVKAVAAINPGIDDDVALDLAHAESRLLLTEDKDFGVLAYAGGLQTAGVVVIRFPGNERSSVRPAVLDAVSQFGDRLSKGFVVVDQVSLKGVLHDEVLMEEASGACPVVNRAGRSRSASNERRR